jgi:hypothetical protein
VLATADALAHLSSDFYLWASAAHAADGKDEDWIREWVLKKSERDFNDKICFDANRAAVRPDYEAIRWQFSAAAPADAL